jgi:hypothetical protein
MRRIQRERKLVDVEEAPQGWIPVLVQEHVVNRNQIQLSIATLLMASLVGCAGLNDCRYESTQKARALREYVKCGTAQCERYPNDYKLGWLDGFYDISTGGPSCPPAVAPQRYWDPKQILKDCDNRRHAYYSGWQDGASRATQFPDTHHLKIFETCECPMPRCESACGPSGCVPCGLGSIGSPVHAELIEMPHQQESVNPMSIVPQAPDTAYEVSEGNANNESAISIAAETDQKIAKAELEMLQTDSIEAEQVQPAANEELASEELASEDLAIKNDATSILGSAFDVLQIKSSTVQIQAQDPIEGLKADGDTSAERAEIETLKSEAIAVAKSEPKLVVPAPKIQEVEKHSDAEDTVGTVRLVEENLIPKVAQAEIKQVVTEVKPEVKPAAVKKITQVIEETPAKPTRHPAVAKETIPVRFEMIESDQATVVQAK